MHRRGLRELVNLVSTAAGDPEVLIESDLEIRRIANLDLPFSDRVDRAIAYWKSRPDYRAKPSRDPT